MKKRLSFLLLASGIFTAGNAMAQTLVHYWNFNNIPAAVYVPTTLINSSYSKIDTTKATVWYTTLPGTSPSYSSYFDTYSNSDSTMGITQNWNTRFGDCACTSLRLRNPSDSMELRAYIPSTHYKNPVVKFVTETSSLASGMQVQAYDYSVDSGATWRTTGISMTVDSPLSLTWSSVTININSTTDTMTRNNRRLVFRTRFRVNNTGTTGNNRIDNLTMEADTLTTTSPGTEVTNLVASIPVYTLYPNPVVNTIMLHSNADGAKSVVIRGMDGKTQFAGLATGKDMPIDVTSLSAGSYLITVQESSTGNTSTMKFIKQ